VTSPMTNTARQPREPAGETASVSIRSEGSLNGFHHCGNDRGETGTGQGGAFGASAGHGEDGPGFGRGQGVVDQ
jgi:hypothetical protein